MKILSKSILGAGIWVFFSPWVLGFSTINLMAWSNWIAGIIIIFSSFTLLPIQKDTDEIAEK